MRSINHSLSFSVKPNIRFDNPGYVIGLILFLLVGCGGSVMPRDGSIINAYISHSSSPIVSRTNLEIGARLWDDVGVNFQLSPEPNAHFSIERMPLNEQYAFAGLTVITEEPGHSTKFKMLLNDGADWHTVAHEFGHALGVPHVMAEGCHIMSPTWCVREGTLSSEDLKAFAESGE